MITETMSVEEAFKFIINNTIEAYISKYNSIEGCKMEINIENEKISINDNAGGIASEADYEKLVSMQDGTGLKKACYKLANNVTLKSNNEIKAFQIILDEDYLNLNTMEYSYNEAIYNDSESKGFFIDMEINESIKKQLLNKKFIEKLRKELESTYRVFIENGLYIKINEKELEIFSPGKLKKEIQLKDGYIRIYETNTGDEGKKNGLDLFIDGWIILDRSKNKISKWKSLQETGYTFINRIIEVVYKLQNNETVESVLEDIEGKFWESVRADMSLFKKNTVGISFDLDKKIAEFLREKLDGGSYKEVGEEAVRRLYNSLKDTETDNRKLIGKLKKIFNLESDKELRNLSYSVLEEVSIKSLEHSILREKLNTEEVEEIINYLFENIS